MQNSKYSWTSAVFRVISESLSIEDISARLYTQPTKYFVKGEPFSKRDPKSRVRKENLWLLESELSDQNAIETHVKYFLAFFIEKKDVIRGLKAECELELTCAYSSENGQGGFTLDHKVLEEFSVFPIDLSINLYPPERWLSG